MSDNRGDQPNSQPQTVVVERGGGGATAIIVAIVLLVAVAIGAVYLLNRSNNDAVRTDAITKAADSVGSAAQKAGDAVTPNH